MGSRLLPKGAVNAAQNAPLYGTVIMNLVEETPDAVIAAIGGDTSMGIPFGFLTTLPTFNVNRETVNITDPIAGLGIRLKGSEQLRSEEGTVELAFAQLSTDNIMYALPGTRKTDWMSAKTGSLTVGTGNSAYTVRAIAPGVSGNSIQYAVTVPGTANANPTGPVVSVTGTAPNYTISVDVSTGTAGAAPYPVTSTANDVIRAINAHAVAKTIVQAGRPATSTGAGIVAASVAAPLAGGSAGTRIGSVLTSQGSWTLADYIRTVHVAWESVSAPVAMLGRVKNAISMGNFSFQGDDGGQMSGASLTLTATADESDYQSATGNYAGPFAFLKLDDVIAA